MEWSTINPSEKGKYIVQTRTIMGNINTFQAFWNGKNWNFNNQTFVKYLKE